MQNFQTFLLREQYIPHAAYARSKLAQVMSTISLEAKMRERNSPVQVMAVHPGIVDTDLFDGTLLKVATPWILSKLSKVLNYPLFIKNLEMFLILVN